MLQGVPFGAAGLLHVPVDGSHVPAVVHGPLAVHATGVPLAHAPDSQASPVKQRLPLLHAVPSGSAGLVHTPVDGLHTPGIVHGPPAMHVMGVPLVHVPAWHVSPAKQRFPVLHTVPFTSGGFEHAPVAGEHVPTPWH